MENLTEIVFILDRSGSMSGLEKDTIGGFNSFVEKQKKEEGRALVTTVLFDTELSTIHDRVPLEKMEKLTEKEYYTGGCTALLDAIGTTVHHIGEIHRYAREEDRPQKTIFVITTDGEENSSREYTYPKIKKLIGKKKEEGWEFIFLGANIDAISTAGRMGIAEECAANYVCDSVGTAVNFMALSGLVGKVRRSKGKAMIDVDRSWKKDIEDYYDEKKGK